MTGEELKNWMEEARVSQPEMARILSGLGTPITTARVCQWVHGDNISEDWASRIERAMAQVDNMDVKRLVSRMN